MSTKPTVSELLVSHRPIAPRLCEWLRQLLEAHGIAAAFAVPGGTLMELAAEFSRHKTPDLVYCGDERGAGFAAWAYADIANQLGVVLVSGSVGATNVLSAVAAAFANRTPLLVINSQSARNMHGRGPAQDGSAFGVDVVAAMRPITALSTTIMSAAQAAAVVPEALSLAQARRQPVFLSIPADVLIERMPLESADAAYRRAPRPARVDLEACERAAAALAKAQRPAILLGGAGRGAEGVVLRLAEQVGAPIATTPEGKGLVPEEHPLALGVFGFASSPRARAALLASEVDVLIAVGTELNELATAGYSRRLRPATLIHIDPDPNVPGRNYPALGLIGEIGPTVRYLASMPALRTRAASDLSWVARLQQHERAVCEPDAASSQAVPLRPERALAELQRCLSQPVSLLCDIGSVMAHAFHELRLGPDQRLLIDLGTGCMGHAPGAALGAMLAQPGRPVVALVGDAGFRMGGFEVHAAAEYRARTPGVGPIYVVLNNGGNGMVEAGTRAQFGDDHGIDTGVFTHPLDIAAIARGMGARAIRVEQPGELEAALREALSRATGPVVLDVRTDLNVMPPIAERVNTLATFSAGEAP